MKAGKFLKYFILAIIAANVALMAVVFLPGMGNQAKPVVPNPNGYDDFVKAEQVLNGNIPDYDAMGRQALGGLVSQYEPALKLFRLGLSRESRVQFDYWTNQSVMIANLSGFKQLILLVRAEGKLAQLDGRTNDAATIYLDGVRFAQESARGGVFIQKLVGIACEAVSLRGLQGVMPGLDARQCTEIARRLEDIDAKEESFADTLAHEKQYDWQSSSIRDKFVAVIRFRDFQKVKKRIEEKIRANTINRRHVMVEFAQRAYELDTGKRAGNVTELVPIYLKAPPND